MSSFSNTNPSHLPFVRDHERLQTLDQRGELSFHRSSSSGEPEVASRDNSTPAGPLRYLPETPPGHSTPCTDPNCLKLECLSDVDCSCLKLTTPTLDDTPQHPPTSPHDERTSTPQQVEFRREDFARSRDACPYNCICICHFFLEDHWQRAEAHAQPFDGADPDLAILDRQAQAQRDIEEYVNDNGDDVDNLAATLGSQPSNMEPHWDDNLYKCAICSQGPPVGPRDIPRCTHLFCKECLLDSVAATILQGAFPVFCPVCQEQAQGGDAPNLVPLSESAIEELGVDLEVREVSDRAARERKRG